METGYCYVETIDGMPELQLEVIDFQEGFLKVEVLHFLSGL
jgi:hypothetical protein